MERRFSLAQLLKSENPDLTLLNETKLNAYHSPEFKNYNLIRNDRSSNNGSGVAVLIQNNIKFKPISLNFTTSILEIVIIKINLRNNKKPQEHNPLSQ